MLVLLVFVLHDRSAAYVNQLRDWYGATTASLQLRLHLAHRFDDVINVRKVIVRIDLTEERSCRPLAVGGGLRIAVLKERCRALEEEHERKDPTATTAAVKAAAAPYPDSIKQQQ